MRFDRVTYGKFCQKCYGMVVPEGQRLVLVKEAQEWLTAWHTPKLKIIGKEPALQLLSRMEKLGVTGASSQTAASATIDRRRKAHVALGRRHIQLVEQSCLQRSCSKLVSGLAGLGFAAAWVPLG